MNAEEVLYKVKILNSIEDENMKEMTRYYLQNKKYCYDCKHYGSSHFCGYKSCKCDIYGSLDCDQHKYHPDETADTCKHYDNNGSHFAYNHLYQMLIKYPNLIEITRDNERLTEKEYQYREIKNFYKNNKK